MALIRVYANLREILRKDEFTIDATSIKEILEVFESFDNTEYNKIMRDENGNMRHNIIILVNGKNVKFLNGLDTKINRGDVIDLFPPVAGG